MNAQPKIDNSPRSHRMMQTVLDLTRRPITELSILDLGCAHGFYALEFGRRGARTLGIEGRASWIAHAEASKNRLGLKNTSFVQADVRDLQIDRYGQFDVVLCLGLLYHLGAQDALDLLGKIYNICTDFAIIDTQIALRPDQSFISGDNTYSGWLYREHSHDATKVEKEAQMGASLDEEFSFWFTRASLLNALRHAGFSSVLECRNPIDNMWVDGELKLHADYVTLVAIKGTPVPIGARSEIDWPEDPTPFYLEQPWSEYALAQSNELQVQHNHLIAERDAVLAERDAVLAERDTILAQRDAILAERDAIKAQLSRGLIEQDVVKSRLSQALAERDAVLASTSWRVSAPLRALSRALRHR